LSDKINVTSFEKEKKKLEDFVAVSRLFSNVSEKSEHFRRGKSPRTLCLEKKRVNLMRRKKKTKKLSFAFPGVVLLSLGG